MKPLLELRAASRTFCQGRQVLALRAVELTVKDRGPGIRQEDLPLVFDRFYRTREARSLPGSGLGLAIVRKVADEHGGSVEAEAGETGGTVVRLRLPCSDGRSGTVREDAPR